MAVIYIFCEGSSTFIDLSVSGNSRKKRNTSSINKNNPGTIGKYCIENDIGLPRAIDMNMFGRWSGAAHELYGGTFREIRNLYSKLLDLGHEVHMIVYDESIGRVSGSKEIHPVFDSENEQIFEYSIPEHTNCDIVVVILKKSSFENFIDSYTRRINFNPSIQIVCSSIKEGSQFEIDWVILPTVGVARIGANNKERLLTLISDFS